MGHHHDYFDSQESDLDLRESDFDSRESDFDSRESIFAKHLVTATFATPAPLAVHTNNPSL